MSSFFRNIVVFGAGCATGNYLHACTHYKEAFTIWDVSFYYPYKLKTDPNEDTVFERKNKD